MSFPGVSCSAQAYGLDATLDAGGHVLTLRTLSPRGVTEVAVSVELQPGRWHSLTLVAKRGMMLAKDRLWAFRDGQPRDLLDDAKKRAVAFHYPAAKGLAKGLNM